MGAQVSTPKPGTKFQVIGAGLPRTGTASFSEALRILLDGPVYHTGTQISTGLGDGTEIRSWNRLLAHWPPRNDGDQAIIKQVLQNLFHGYAAATDSPTAQLVPELLELYPEAIVICTVRDAKAWEKSIATVTNLAVRGFLRFVLFPLPAMRPFPEFVDHMLDVFDHLYNERVPTTSKTYERHIEWLKRVVPEDRLVFFSVKDGWEPLCKALGKEVPKEVPFPRINDAEAVEKLSSRHVKQGLTRWAVAFATVGAVAYGVWMVRT